MDIQFYKNDKLKIVFFKEKAFGNIVYGYVILGTYQYILKPLYQVESKYAVTLKHFIQTNSWNIGKELSYKELLKILKYSGYQIKTVKI